MDETQVTVDVEQSLVMSKEEIALKDAIMYLGSFTLPLTEDTIKITSEDGVTNQATLDPVFALRLRALLKRKEAMEEEIKQFKDYAKAKLSAANITDVVSSNGVNLLYTEEHTRNSIDVSKLREMLPDLAEFFNKQTKVSSSVAIKIDPDEVYNPWLK